jgi:hypothetical protein
MADRRNASWSMSRPVVTNGLSVDMILRRAASFLIFFDWCGAGILG